MSSQKNCPLERSAAMRSRSSPAETLNDLRLSFRSGRRKVVFPLVQRSSPVVRHTAERAGDVGTGPLAAAPCPRSASRSGGRANSLSSLIGLHPRERRVEHGVLGLDHRRVCEVDRERRVRLGVCRPFSRALRTSCSAFLLSTCSRTWAARSSQERWTPVHQAEMLPLLSSVAARSLSACACAEARAESMSCSRSAFVSSRARFRAGLGFLGTDRELRQLVRELRQLV